jgi:hypothetical protein
MNDTKWEELRRSMYGLGALSPKWRTKDTESGYVSEWDSEWYYHFSVGVYKSIEWAEIRTESPEQNAAVEDALRTIHVPGCKTENGFKVFGYLREGSAVDYI